MNQPPSLGTSGGLDDIPLPPGSGGSPATQQIFGLDSGPGTPLQDENVIIEDELSISNHVTALSPDRSNVIYTPPIDMDIEVRKLTGADRVFFQFFPIRLAADGQASHSRFFETRSG